MYVVLRCSRIICGMQISSEVIRCARPYRLTILHQIDAAVATVEINSDIVQLTDLASGLYRVESNCL